MDQKIFNYLLETGCCKVCSLRYLNDKHIDFGDVDDYIKKVNSALRLQRVLASCMYVCNCFRGIW